jgi:hypothetical protein
MPRGAAVVRYEGKRGAVWRIKYRDAAGKQVLETLGPERSGPSAWRSASSASDSLPSTKAPQARPRYVRRLR